MHKPAAKSSQIFVEPISKASESLLNLFVGVRLKTPLDFIRSLFESFSKLILLSPFLGQFFPLFSDLLAPLSQPRGPALFPRREAHPVWPSTPLTQLPSPTPWPSNCARPESPRQPSWASNRPAPPLPSGPRARQGPAGLLAIPLRPVTQRLTLSCAP